MKILVLAERLPSPLGGGSARQLNLIKELSSRHQYTVLAHAFSEDLIYQDQLLKVTERIEVIPLQTPAAMQESNMKLRWQAWQHTLLDPHPQRGRFFQTSAFQQKLSHLLTENNFDLIQIHQAYLVSLVSKTDIPILLDMHDILSTYELNLLQSTRKITHRMQAWAEWKKMIALEKAAGRRAQVIVTVSESDSQEFLELLPNASVRVVPNGVDISYYQPRPEVSSTNDVIFMGSLNYFPNSDAVRWFYNEIWPKIISIRPQATWKIVGWHPPQDILAYHRPPEVEVTGFVEDVRPHIAESSIVVVPLRYGTGTRLKILDAWSMGKPVVSTTLGAQGLAAEHGRNILLADDPNQFADYILQLLTDPNTCKLLGQSGRVTVETRFSWRQLSQQMEAAYKLASSNPSI